MWFFQFKVGKFIQTQLTILTLSDLRAVVVLVSSVGVVIAMCKKAGGAGDIWKQEYGVFGAERSWLILSAMSSITGGW